METARCIWEVQAGIIPGVPMPEYGKCWGLTSSEWAECLAANEDDNDFNRRMEAAHAAGMLLELARLRAVAAADGEEFKFEPAANMQEAFAAAHEYAMGLSSRPDLVNWVRID